MKREPRPRRVWKTFYITSGRAFNDLASCWKSFGADPKHKMFFEDGIGIIETNLPIADLRDLFRAADVRFPTDYTTDTKPTSED
jgi:hypothetical protein